MISRKSLRLPIACLMSVANGVFGLLSIFLSLHGMLPLAAFFLFIAALFDFLDGKFARKTNTVSSFGKELDSLADLVSFIIAPLIFAFMAGFQAPYFIVLYVIYFMAGLLRLARYNLRGMLDGNYFEGVPVTVSIIIPALYFLFSYLNINLVYWSAFYFVHAVLMLSHIRIKKLG